MEQKPLEVPELAIKLRAPRTKEHRKKSQQWGENKGNVRFLTKVKCNFITNDQGYVTSNPKEKSNIFMSTKRRLVSAISGWISENGRQSDQIQLQFDNKVKIPVELTISLVNYQVLGGGRA